MATKKPTPAPPRWGAKSGAAIAQGLAQPKPAPAPTPAPAARALAAAAPAATAPAARPVAAAAPAVTPAPVAAAPAAAPAPAAAAPAPADTKTAPAAAAPAAAAVADGDDDNGSEVPSRTETPAAAGAGAAAADDAADVKSPAGANGDADADEGEDSAPAAAAAGAGAGAAGADGRNPLQCEWTMWYEVSKKGKTSSKNFAPERKKIMSFDTVEDFWCLWNNILKPSELSQKRTNSDKTDYLLFKSGVKPEWEDNKGGGVWQLQLGKNLQDVDEQWELSALGLIGDQFDLSEELLGAALRLRPKGSRLELWTKGCNLEVVRDIGRQYKEILNYESRISFSSFQALKNQESKAMLEV